MAAHHCLSVLLSNFDNDLCVPVTLHVLVCHPGSIPNVMPPLKGTHSSRQTQHVTAVIAFKCNGRAASNVTPTLHTQRGRFGGTGTNKYGILSGYPVLHNGHPKSGMVMSPPSTSRTTPMCDTLTTFPWVRLWSGQTPG